MYCVKCGVELADSELKCPLCNTKVILPEGEKREVKPPLYPAHPGGVSDGMTTTGILFVLTMFFLIPTLLCLCCDLSLNHRIVWSGITMLSTAFVYFVTILPFWSPKRISPIILVPADFAALLGLLLYINCKTGGHWFLSLAFPVVGAIGLIATAVTVLRRFCPGKNLFIYGGALIALGCLSILAEFLVIITFNVGRVFTWCFYPLIVFCIIGILFIAAGISPSLREGLRRKLFF